MDNLLTAALQAAGRGWPVFVLGRSKRPLANCPACRNAPADHDPAACDCLTCHGFYAATTDPDRLTAMLTANPRGLLAVRTGTVSGLLVADIDPGHGGRIDPVLMPPTLAVATGNHGWHLYYRHPGYPVLSRPLPGVAGVDIKADGGYVVLPPSIHPVTKLPYRWLSRTAVVNGMPPALEQAVTTTTGHATLHHHTTGTPATQVQCQTTGGGGISSPTALLNAHLAAVTSAPEGRRRTTLYGAARGIARLIAAGFLDHTTAITALTDAGRNADQSDRDIRGAITGGFRDEGLTP